MSAVALVLQLLRTGDRVAVTHDCYGGTHRLVRALAERGQLDVKLTDMTDPSCINELTAWSPQMIWVETPSNPLLRITDIARLAAVARDTGALLVVDNTFLSPAWQQPLEHGADVVVHSTTKFINGHSDVVGGAAIAKAPEVLERLAWWANCIGLAGAPFDSYLTLRGLRTLDARTRIHAANAHEVVELLSVDDRVARVFYPGLSDHPGHETAARQQTGWGSLISFELHGGEPAVRTFVESLRCFSLAESLGGVESLVAHPATMTHAAMDAESRRAVGIGDSLIRLSVGIENVDDLLADLSQALDRVGRTTCVTA